MTNSLTRAANGVRTWIQGIGPAPIAALAGLAALVYGISRIHVPSAWIAAGLLLLAFGIYYDRGQRRHEVLRKLQEMNRE